MSARWGVLLFCSVLTACGGGKSPFSDLDQDGVANAQDCSPVDATRWQQLAFQSVDADGDGLRVNSPGQVCSGTALPATHSTTTVAPADEDCDDSDANRWRQLPYTARDADGDSYIVAATGNVCSGNALPTGYSNATPDSSTLDCDDSSPRTWRLMTSYQDRDGDGIGSGRGAVACVGLTAQPGFSIYGYDPVDDPSDPDTATSNFDLPAWALQAPKT